MLSSGFAVIRGVAPAAMVTSIVSPMARDMASMKEATMPDRAAGTTTFRLVSSLVAPKAYEACRSDLGTLIMASSLSDDTMGMIMTPMTTPALSALKTIMSGKILWSWGVTKVRAK